MQNALNAGEGGGEALTARAKAGGRGGGGY